MVYLCRWAIVVDGVGVFVTGSWGGSCLDN